MSVQNIMLDDRRRAWLFVLNRDEFKAMKTWCRESMGKSHGGERDSNWHVRPHLSPLSTIPINCRGIVLTNHMFVAEAVLTWG